MRLAAIISISCFLATAATAVAAPASQPATAVLLSGQVEFTPPPDWNRVKEGPASDTAVAYLAADRDGFLTLQISPVVADNAAIDANQITAKLRLKHTKSGQDIVLTPTVEADARFALKIHERYKLKSGKTADESHMYKRLAHRILELDVQSLSNDAAHVDLVRKAAEEMLASVRLKGADPNGGGTPASQPAAPVATAVLLQGKIEFTPPPEDWKVVKSKMPAALAAIYITDGENTQLFLQVLPTDAMVDANAAKTILRQIRMNHQKGEEESISPPALETDARFPIKIRERFKLRDGRVADVSRMYRQLGGRVLELDVLSFSADFDHVESFRKTGEEVLMSAHWKKGK